MSTALHLAFREIWRNRGRFALFSMVIALITVLILFIAALGEGLGSGNREYLQKLDADLIVYQDTARLSVGASRLERDTLRSILNVEGVQRAGPLGLSSSSVIRGGAKPMDISLIGVEPGQPGEPPVVAGEQLQRREADEVILDRTVALMTQLQPGEWLILRSPQGTKEEFFALQVVGITDSRKYSLRAAVFVPYATWDKVRPKANANAPVDLTSNVVAVQLTDPARLEEMRQRLVEQVGRIEVVDRVTAYESTPGYREQQSTLQTQNYFALLIGLLVIGGFFQIQTLQKVAQFGMLKAIGTPNSTVAIAVLAQIITVNVLGVILGGLATFGLSLSFPPNIPIVFEPRSGLTALASILFIGPLGGLISMRYALRVEPLTALGLSQ